MSPIRLSLLAACIAVAGTAAHAQSVVINEFQYDDSSTDDREFVELYNAGSTPVDISGWVLDANDEAGPTASNNRDYRIPPGTVLQPGQFYVLGSSIVPNVNLVVGATDLWENSNESIELRDQNGVLIDAVAYETYLLPANSAAWAADLAAQIGEGIWSTFSSIDGSECSWSRYRDGYDTNNNGRDFRQIRATPGTSNNVPSILPYVELFDTLTHNTPVPGWSYSFVPFTAIDPANQSPPNPLAIPASPQGGSAAIVWDPTGGGDYATLETDAEGNLVYESYVWFDALFEPTAEYENWTIGIQGSADSFGNHPGFPGGPTAGFTGYGGTGVSLIFANNEFGGTLYLVDVNDGGWGATTAITPERILGQIPIVTGVNDGWQRIRLRAGNGAAELRFGGTFSQNDGQVLFGDIAMAAPGGMYFSYREFLNNNGAANPPIVDFVVISTGTADVESLHAGTPNSTGTPTLSANSMPTLGNASFALTASGLTPTTPAFLLLGFSEAATPIDLAPLGAPAGTRVYIDIAVGLSALADANGEIGVGLGVPSNPALSGGAIYAQCLNVDPAIGALLPIATTAVVKATLGN
jgi:hypothetical protein